jgi:hypothetical protein
LQIAGGVQSSGSFEGAEAVVRIVVGIDQRVEVDLLPV